MRKIIILFLIFSIVGYSKEKAKESISNSAILALSKLEEELKSKKYDLEFFIGKYTIPYFLKKDLELEIKIKGDKKGLNYRYENSYFKNSSIELYLNEEAKIRYLYKKDYNSLFDIVPLYDLKKKTNKKKKTEK
jgi:replication-associated recombination protein RarA